MSHPTIDAPETGIGAGLSVVAEPVDARTAEGIAVAQYGIAGAATWLAGEKDSNFRLDAGAGTAYFLKILSPGEDPAVSRLHSNALIHVARAAPDLPLPRIVPTRAGEPDRRITVAPEDRRTVRLTTFTPGRSQAAGPRTDGQRRAAGALLARLQGALEGFADPAADHVSSWDLRHAGRLRAVLDVFPEGGQRDRLAGILDAFALRVVPALSDLPHQVVHNDLGGDNILVDPDDPDRITGVIDFGDMVRTARMFDVAIAAAYQLGLDADPLGPALAFLRGYASVARLSEAEIALLPTAIRTRMALRLLIPEWRARRFPERRDYLTRNSAGVWTQFRHLDALAPEAIDAAIVEACRPWGHAITAPSSSAPPASAEALIGRRRSLLGASYRLFYERPVHIVRGEDVWLYDAEGRRYLDAYNNVPCVGHCHPRVVEAVTRQMATLNTHTRYLHEAVLDYSERLLSTYPAAFGHVMYTCTGSEAVDLALRIARYQTGGTGLVITRNAYHGTTEATAGISPSLGPNVPLGRDVWTVPAPDAYRNPGIDVGARLAEDVRAAFADMRRHGVRPAAFIADGIFSTDGTLAEPAGFLRPAREAVREAGALYIADEVQPGFGRTGAGMWGFARHGIVPDMAVMGKPMGNGLPIAGVAMRPEVAEKFGRDVRYFNTFGANTVSIAAAGAVLDILADQDLVANAAATGGLMLEGMRALMARIPAIGDVRGAGLFLGVDLVTCRESRAPDAALAKRVVNALREESVLISASGPHDNVLKIRPPLTFSAEHAALFLEVLGKTLDGAA